MDHVPVDEIDFAAHMLQKIFAVPALPTAENLSIMPLPYIQSPTPSQSCPRNATIYLNAVQSVKAPVPPPPEQMAEHPSLVMINADIPRRRA